MIKQIYIVIQYRPQHKIYVQIKVKRVYPLHRGGLFRIYLIFVSLLKVNRIGKQNGNCLPCAGLPQLPVAAIDFQNYRIKNNSFIIGLGGFSRMATFRNVALNFQKFIINYIETKRKQS